MKIQEMKFKFQGKNITTFRISQDQKAYLSRLFDLPCGFDGKDTIPEGIKGMSCFDSNLGCFSTDNLSLAKHSFEENSASFTFCDTDEQILTETNWKLCSQTGIWNRKDRIQNSGKKSVSLSRYLARFVFTPGSYEIFSQGSSWSNENHGLWRDITHGSIVLKNEGGRTTQGATPYMCLRDKESHIGIAFHIVPRGNWVIKISSYTAKSGYSLPFVVVELGLADEHLSNPQRKGSLLFVYRLNDACEEKTFYMRKLESETKYSITVEHKSSTKASPLTGSQLMSQGITVKLPQRNDAAVYVFEI